VAIVVSSLDPARSAANATRRTRGSWPRTQLALPTPRRAGRATVAAGTARRCLHWHEGPTLSAPLPARPRRRRERRDYHGVAIVASSGDSGAFRRRSNAPN